MIHDLADRADLIQSVEPARHTMTQILTYLLAALAGLIIGLTL
jgi:hypothetical protein